MLTQLRRKDALPQAFFRFRHIGGNKVVLTNIEGDYLVVDEPEFRLFAEDRLEVGSALYERFSKHNFLKATYDVKKAADGLRTRKPFLRSGPNLHIMVVTLRCNQTCVYCHASRAPMDAVSTDMSVEVAERSVDMALSTTSPFVTIEFQGGEPLVVFDRIKHIVAYAKQRNEALGKSLEFTMVSNLTMMDDEKLEWLLDNRVQISTSIDGPKHLHDKQRTLPGHSAHDLATGWIRKINKAYQDAGLDPNIYHVEALLTTTKSTLPLYKEVVDTYVDLGCRALFLRPLDPFGFVGKTGEKVKYPKEAYLEFYRNALEYILELNGQGVQILERFASIFLTKIFSGQDPNYLDIRDPCGAAIGQIAYNQDGKVFTCDEGRMLHEEGDDSFLIGDVANTSYREVVGHETVRAMAVASNLDQQPDCVNCAYQPYCGVCPVHNHKTQGTLFGRMRESSLCSVHKGIQDYLFEKLGAGDRVAMDAFRRWTTIRARDHFIQ
ncbi:MAG: His-Xaa-Ser system radical SAM maturase HxsB [Myxococcales bacterium]|nr:His-Xaa-Ser system radical SAM maturase HxsB [Myxococcales bacterium]